MYSPIQETKAVKRIMSKRMLEGSGVGQVEMSRGSSKSDELGCWIELGSGRATGVLYAFRRPPQDASTRHLSDTRSLAHPSSPGATVPANSRQADDQPCELANGCHASMRVSVRGHCEACEGHTRGHARGMPEAADRLRPIGEQRSATFQFCQDVEVICRNEDIEAPATLGLWLRMWASSWLYLGSDLLPPMLFHFTSVASSL